MAQLKATTIDGSLSFLQNTTNTGINLTISGSGPYTLTTNAYNYLITGYKTNILSRFSRYRNIGVNNSY